MAVMKLFKQMQQKLIRFLGKHVSTKTEKQNKKKLKKLQRKMNKVEERVPKKIEMATTDESEKQQQTASNVAGRATKQTDMAAMEKPEKKQHTATKVDEVTEKNVVAAMAKQEQQQQQQTPSEADERVTKKTEMPVTEKVSKIQQTPSKLPGEELGVAPPPAAKDGGDHSPGGEPDAAPRAPALRMDAASCYLPQHGEDAYFVLANAGVVGVADGVGSYRKKGIDAGAFARALMKNAAAAGPKRTGNNPVRPCALLRRAYEATARSRTPGASTALILSLHRSTLRWAYVGDSGFAVLRGGKIVHRSKPQQHRPNCPHQLCAKGGDSLSTAAVGNMPVVAGDVVVAGTDGLFDNVSDVELECLVREGTELGLSSQDMADDIADNAIRMSLHRKADDITVVVAFIVAA
ncbi:hypothetical protein ACP70R_026600 [Stipagrostis hirtigluma subsp. patula]